MINSLKYITALSIILLSGIINDTHAEGIQEGCDKSKGVIIRSIDLQGNKVTKERIIFRELLFHPGDTICPDSLGVLMEKSRENLLNTSLFNFVTIDTVEVLGSSLVNVNIKMLERWYIWPFPIFELSDRNFNSWLESGDLSRVSYGAFITWENFRGRKETFKLRLQFGYDEKYDLYYKIPYINRKETLGLAFGIGLAQNHETSYMTQDNKLLYYKNDDKHVKKNGFTYIQLLGRKDIYNSHKVELSYNYMDFDDTLLVLNPDFTTSDKPLNRFMSLYYQYKSDHRDFHAYPLTGYYFDAAFKKLGLGVVSNDVDVFYITSTFRQYWQLSNRFFYAFNLNAKFSDSKSQPYFLLRGLGYGRDFVRSFEYYVVDGQNYGLFKSNLKFAILPPKVSDLKFIPFEKFSKIHYALYLNVFLDLGYVDNPYNNHIYNNYLENSLLVGYGIGLDLVTYYDIVIRGELSFNKYDKPGLFLHFIAPI